MTDEKLQKVLARAGLGSRREMERWITTGRVTVNDRSAGLGDRVTAADRILVDGRLVDTAPPARPRVLLLNKPEGVICTRHDPEGRRTCYDGLPALARGRWVSIGRLDVNTSGLLLLTNDGALAHRMMHPSTGLDREYAVRVDRLLEPEVLAALTEGVPLDGTVGRFSDIQHYDGRGNNHWYHVVLMEGRNREVRALFESQGVRVSRLKRVRFGPVVLPSWLKRGRSADLCVADLKVLYRLLRLPAPAVTERRGARPERSVLIPYPELPALGR